MRLIYRRGTFKLLILFMIAGKFGYTQQYNPRQYFDYINQAELAICDSNYKGAVAYYKQAFQYLKEPFGKDLFNCLHCGLIAEDKSVVDICIPKYKERSYFLPYWVKDYADLPIKKYLDSIYANSFITSKLDTNYRNFIHELTKKDQAIRKEVVNLSENEAGYQIWLTDSINLTQLKQYIDSTGIFPTESVVGNFGNTAFCELPYELLLIHSAYASVAVNFEKPINLQLDKRVLSGEFPPDLYAHLCDFRGYGIDGKAIGQKSRYGADISIHAISNKSKNPTYNPIKKATWKQKLIIPKRTQEQVKAIDKRRREMNMEPFKDLLKKVRYQMNLDFMPFCFVNSWYTGVFFD